MNLFESLETHEHEQLVFCSDKESGLKAIIAIHSTTLGPSLGGCRMWPYENEEAALKDVLRLSRGMTYKAAVAGLNLGGGKAVIIGDSKTMKNETLFRSFGRFVQSLGGRYITAEDVGTSVHDMEWVSCETNFVTGIHQERGGSGDPSPVTALGVFFGIKAALKWKSGSDSFAGKRVVVQGLGQVGQSLVTRLVEAGAKVVAADIFEGNIKKAVAANPSIEIINPDAVYSTPCDIFVPCALGGVVNDDTIDKLRCGIVAGSANNVLADEDKHSVALQKKDILYIPDFVISAGGLINVANELQGYRRQQALDQASGIYDIVMQILKIAEVENTTTQKASMTLAERRIAQLGHIKKKFIGVPLGKRMC